MREIKYACPFCQTAVAVREGDIPPGKGVNVACGGCHRTLHLPDRIWCPRCRQGLVDLEQILQYAAEENHVGLEQLKREGLPPTLDLAEINRLNQEIANLRLFGSATANAPSAPRPPSPSAPRAASAAPAPARSGPKSARLAEIEKERAAQRIILTVCGLILLAIVIFAVVVYFYPLR